MAWSASAIFREFLENPGIRGISGATAPTGASASGITADTVKVALFDSSITPDRTVANASAGYNVGQWATADEVIDATNWVAGGRALANDAFTSTDATAFIMYDADDLAGGGTVTLADANGCLVYDDSITSGSTIADLGICYNWFGGAQSVTAGTFTIVWHANGVFRITV
jgi:hypothetical protein